MFPVGGDSTAAFAYANHQPSASETLTIDAAEVKQDYHGYRLESSLVFNNHGCARLGSWWRQQLLNVCSAFGSTLVYRRDVVAGISPPVVGH